ncbi:MAG: glutamate racemase [Firmicutes bacterium]|nr:glutamate racemase [Bacillota bacterium]
MDFNKNELSIGVFDSGMGGISVLGDLMKLMPNENFIYYGDSNNAPYGLKSVEEIVNLSINVCDFLISKGVKGIVIACNTATSAAVKILRKKYNIPIIGMEPAVKPAIRMAKNKKIVALATPITLKEKKFKNLLKKLNIEDDIIKIPAPELVCMVENGNIQGEKAKEQVENYFNNINLEEIGAIVLGCTHFVFLKDIIKNVLGYNIKIIDGNLGTAKHLKNILKNSNMIYKNNDNQRVEIYNSSNNEKMIELSYKLLEFIIKQDNIA